MTREEAIELLQHTSFFGRSMDDIDTAIDMAIKALEQEPILDKIRAEIESTMKYQYAVGENQYAEGFEKSLEIIDKYRAESEK